MRRQHCFPTILTVYHTLTTQLSKRLTHRMKRLLHSVHVFDVNVNLQFKKKKVDFETHLRYAATLCEGEELHLSSYLFVSLAFSHCWATLIKTNERTVLKLTDFSYVLFYYFYMADYPSHIPAFVQTLKPL